MTPWVTPEIPPDFYRMLCRRQWWSHLNCYSRHLQSIWKFTVLYMLRKTCSVPDLQFDIMSIHLQFTELEVNSDGRKETFMELIVNEPTQDGGFANWRFSHEYQFELKYWLLNHTIIIISLNLSKTFNQLLKEQNRQTFDLSRNTIFVLNNESKKELFVWS